MVFASCVNKEPVKSDASPRHSLDDARRDVISARGAAVDADDHRRVQYARSAVDAAAEVVLDPTASRREVAAARRVLDEGLALDDRVDRRTSDRRGIDEASTGLSEAERRWIDDYLATRPTEQSGPDRCLGR